MIISLIVIGGAGRMGSTIIRSARQSQEFSVVAAIERAEYLDKLPDFIPNAADLLDILPEHPQAVIIDFTSPENSMRTARLAAASGNPVVIGTTGLSAEQKTELEQLARQTAIFYSPNMSLGINVLVKILPELVRLLDGYDMEVMEIHHNKKKDSPSGTALRLAETLASAKGWKLEDSVRYCREGITGERPVEEIGIQTLRGGDVVGVHTTYFMGPGERIEITHQAHSRDNFANGALKAARWLAGRTPGRLYAMHDVFSCTQSQ